MADKARKLTDQELNKLEREIYTLYATAANEISAEWRKYMASHKKTLDQAYNELQEAKKSGNRDAIAEANEKYERTVKNVTLNDIRYKAMLNETTAKLANINQIALDYVNGDMPKIYTLNYNAFGDEKIDGYTFTLVNERAIAELALSNEIRLPKKKINVPKDEAWNAKNINSQLMQGILQGESVAKIAKRLRNVTNMNRNSAIRNARTMTTGAENQGRQDSFKKASSDGVLMKRRWVATHDERVRAWHSDLDGVEVDVDEPFQNDFGDIMFPGDPTAAAANVYNCRCSIRAVVKGFAWNKQSQKDEFNDEDIKISDETRRNDVLGVDINKEHFEHFSDEFKDVIPKYANMIANGEYPSMDELFELYAKVETAEDKLLCKFLSDSQTYVQSYKDFSNEQKKQYAEIFSVLNRPSDTKLFRGESGEWVNHYGEFTVGKTIEFESISFTTPKKPDELLALSNYDVLFEFKEGTPCINTINQVWDDSLILGNFEIVKSEILDNGQRHVVLEAIDERKKKKK